MEFINIGHPDEGTSSQLKRQAYAHAARVTHARARKRQVAEHQRQKGIAAENVPEGDASNHMSQSSTQMIMPHQQHNQVLIHQGAKTSLPPAPSGAFEHEPFAGFLRSLSPREHFMFNYYIEHVFPYLKKYCPIIESLGKIQLQVRNNWVLSSSHDVDFLRGFLLAACRHLSMVRLEEEYAELAIQYKLSHIQVLRQAIATNHPESGRTIVTRALVLAFDEIMLGDLPMAGKHVFGALHVVQKAGGPQALGLTTFMTYILNSCVHGKRLLEHEPALSCGDMFMKPEPVYLGSTSALLIEPPVTQDSSSFDVLSLHG